MKANNYLRAFILLVAAFVFASTAAAQEARPADAPASEEQRPKTSQPHDNHPNMLHQLGLSEEQIQQIRKLNAEKRPLMDEAQKRSREANRTLNEAIYADQVNETDVHARLKEVQLAQAEVAKLRFMNEFAVRRILTQEQLIRFRELRQRFEKARETLEMRRNFKGDRPFSRQRPGKDVNKPQDAQP